MLGAFIMGIVKRKGNTMEPRINLQITLEGDYATAFTKFKENHPMDGRSNVAALQEMIRQTSEYMECRGVMKTDGPDNQG